MRQTGLEPVRLGHTPLKRACLPVPALPHLFFIFEGTEFHTFSLIIISCRKANVKHFFQKKHYYIHFYISHIIFYIQKIQTISVTFPAISREAHVFQAISILTYLLSKGSPSAYNTTEEILCRCIIPRKTGIISTEILFTRSVFI